MPRTEQFADGLVGIFSSKFASVTANGRVLWEGRHGETATFKLEKPTEITIDLGSWANPTDGIVSPTHTYELVPAYGLHWQATFRLLEVDIPDSGL